MIHNDEIELRNRIKKVGLSIKHIAFKLEIAPGTLSGQLYGWAPLSADTRKKISEVINEAGGPETN